jgi:hypothetical protein
MLDGPFDSDEASDRLSELEKSQDVAGAMAEAFTAFLAVNRDYVQEAWGEEVLAIACLVAARVSGIAPDEEAHHWLDRNPFTVSPELRDLAAKAFDLATRKEDNHYGEDVDDDYWREFLDGLEPYRRSLSGEPQEPPSPFVPDFSGSPEWFVAHWATPYEGLEEDSAYARAAEALRRGVNASAAWLDWWRPAGLQELYVFCTLDDGEPVERISRGRATAEAWVDLGHTQHVPEEAVAADVRRVLAAVGDHLGLGPLPALP